MRWGSWLVMLTNQGKVVHVFDKVNIKFLTITYALLSILNLEHSMYRAFFVIGKIDNA